MNNYEIKYSFPTNEEFNELFLSVGWSAREDNKINLHREKSNFSVCIFNNNQIIGMARVVGDGSYYTVYDVVVKREHQGKGIGKKLMTEIVNWYKSIEDDDTYLYLGASYGKEKFYEKFGFKSRPYKNIGSGMKYDIN